ncbi:ABC transporter permease [Bacillus sp. SD088]|uniref:ABC transporter permease n=1 Tax=Bacillus sp. SD088 TaxID=2782012 RepID=UPI001A97B3D3|nr:ABC transporter permease [Bacillus sp. SD088]MBO0995006.1 ABC transporter permease [Bacillus sp. SD088]
MKMFRYQCHAEMLRMLRNPYYLFWSLLMPIVFYFIFTKVVNTGVPDQDEWNAHYLMSMTTFSVMGSSIMTMGIRLVEERSKGWTTFIRVTPLSDLVYYSAKMVGQTMVHICSVLVIFITGVLLNGVSLSALEWIFSAGWILLASLPFLALGILIGTMRRVDTAIGVSNVMYMALAITGGMWMPMEILPNIIQKIGAWLPAYHFGNGAWEIIRGHAPEFRNFAILAAYLLVFMVLSTYIRRKQEAV